MSMFIYLVLRIVLSNWIHTEEYILGNVYTARHKKLIEPANHLLAD